MQHPKAHITIHDIARELGISASTVSRALKDNPRISAATRQAVHELAEKYQYKPNGIAASLRMGKGNTVGVIVPNIHRSFFSNVIAGMEEVLSKAGYNLMICQSNEKLEKEKAAISTLINARVDAILMSLSMETDSYDHFETLVEAGMKLVFFDRIPHKIAKSSVVINDYQAAYRLTEHLIEQGYRRPAHVGGSESINVYADRKRGFTDALLAHGINYSDDYVIITDMTKDGGEDAFDRFMELPIPPDAIMCSGDFTALGVAISARKRNIRIPEELGITGFANEDFTAFVSPPITTIDQHGRDVGREAAQAFLQEDMNGGQLNKIIEPSLLLRESSTRK